MGWPKKREGYRLYYERKKKTYLLVIMDGERNFIHSCVAELMTNNDPEHPCLFHGECSEIYIRNNWLKRVQWNEVPEVWRQTFKDAHFDIEPIEEPETIRGLWRVGCMPSLVYQTEEVNDGRNAEKRNNRNQGHGSQDI